MRGSLGEWCAENGAGEVRFLSNTDNLYYIADLAELVSQEETLDIEYIESVMPPEKMSSLPHEDWVSSISCQIQG